MATSMHDDNIKAAETAIALYMPYNKPAGTNIMKENEKGGRLDLWKRMRKEAKDKEEVVQDGKDLSPSEIKKLAATIENLEVVCNDFKKTSQEQSLTEPSWQPCWALDDIYTDEQIEEAKDKTHVILAATKKRYLLNNNPSIVQALHRNLLEKINAGVTVFEGLNKEAASQTKTTQELSSQEPTQEVRPNLSDEKDGKMEIQENEFSLEAQEHWKKFLKKLEDTDYVPRYKECIGELEKMCANGACGNRASTDEGIRSMAVDDPEKNLVSVSMTQKLATIDYHDWNEEEMKKLCWLEVVKILKVCGKEDLLTSNLYIVGELYKDCLIRNGFAEEEMASAGKVSMTQAKASDVATGLAIVCAEPPLPNETPSLKEQVKTRQEEKSVSGAQNQSRNEEENEKYIKKIKEAFSKKTIKKAG
jgi:hypothetical protein